MLLPRGFPRAANRPEAIRCVRFLRSWLATSSFSMICLASVSGRAVPPTHFSGSLAGCGFLPSPMVEFRGLGP